MVYVISYQRKSKSSLRPYPTLSYPRLSTLNLSLSHFNVHCKKKKNYGHLPTLILSLSHFKLKKTNYVHLPTLILKYNYRLLHCITFYYIVLQKLEIINHQRIFTSLKMQM